MKVGIVGAGMVGSAAGYAIALRGTASQVVFVDYKPEFAIAQAQDIAHATPFVSSTIVSAGDYDALAGADVVILSAGVGQKPGETRLDLLARNADVFKQIIGKVLAVAPDAISFGCFQSRRHHDADSDALVWLATTQGDRVRARCWIQLVFAI